MRKITWVIEEEQLKQGKKTVPALASWVHSSTLKRHTSYRLVRTPDSTHENTRDPQIQAALISFVLICHAHNANETQTLKWHGNYTVKKARTFGIWHAQRGAVSTFSSSSKGGLHVLNDSPRGSFGKGPPGAYIHGLPPCQGPAW